jgi:cell division protease FtsH
MSSDPLRKAFFPLVIVAALVWLVAQTLVGGDSSSAKLAFSEALALAQQRSGEVRKATFHPSTQKVDLYLVSGTKRTTVYPVEASAFELQKLLEQNHVPFDAKSTGQSPWWSILTSLLPFVLLFGFWIFLMRNMRRTTGPASRESPFGR